MFPMVVALLASAATWEYEQFVKAKGGQIITPVLLAVAFFEVIAFALPDPVRGWPFWFFFAAFLLLFALHFRQKEGAIVDLAVSSFGLLYIAVPMGMIVGILHHAPDATGRFWVIYLISVTKITDVAAYFAGSLWGKRKLAPMISPGKTVEGAVFGLISAIGMSFIFFLFADGSMTGRYDWLWLGLVLGLTSQFGDLSESLLKRDANKKDSNAIPGLGGVLDSVDSLLFNAPLVYLYLNNWRV
jgi:phosphatidate cytidylyltransferase